MFTGIIESTAKILAKTDTGLTIARPVIFDDLKIGCSIAVSGACLSVTAFDNESMSFDVVPTTFSKTKIGSLKVGDSVNLERAMKADGRFDGHIVMGHSEGVGIVVVAPEPAPTPTPTPGPSPWPSIAYAMSGKQGEGSSVLTQFDQLRGRVWKGTSDNKRSSHTIVEHARDMRRVPTPAEKKLWDALKESKIDGVRFRRQHPVGNYILDFYADAFKLAVEVDGEIHNDPALKEYESHRTEDLNSRGISVMRFSNTDVFECLKDVLSAIRAFGRAPLTRPTEDERSEDEVPGEGPGVGANATGRSMHKSSTSNPAGDGGLETGSGLEANAALLTVQIPSRLMKFIVLHGSITLDGVALTVAGLKGSEVTVAVIPHTLAHTTLGSITKGDTLNVESDIVGKYILKAHGNE